MLYIDDIGNNTIRFGNAVGGGQYTKYLSKPLYAESDLLGRVWIKDGYTDINYLNCYDPSQITLDGTVYDAENFVSEFNILGSLLNYKVLVQRGSDYVLAAPYFKDADLATGGYLSNAFSAPNDRALMTKGGLSRIRTDGLLGKIRCYVNSITGVAALNFKIWRKNGLGTYDYIGGEDIKSKITPGQWNLITLTTPFEVKVGDCYGIEFDGSAYNGAIFGHSTHSTIYTFVYYTTNSLSSSPFDFEAVNLWNTYTPFIYCYVQSPLMVGIGESIIAGHPGHYSFIEASNVVDLANCIDGQLKLIDSNYSVQNMGIGGQTSAVILARFQADCIDLKPKLAYICAGWNDILGGVLKATYISNITAMLDLCDANNIIPIIIKLPPAGATYVNNSNMQKRDDWMASVKTLVESYTGGMFIDLDSSMGEFRVGGDVGNLWDLKDPYDSGDGLHPSLEGYAKIAELLDAKIKEFYRFV